MDISPTRNLTQQLVHELGIAIVQGAYSSEKGMPSEADICQQYEISRSATREAVKMLTAKGLLSSRPRQGIRIQPRTSWNLFDTDVLSWILSGTPSLTMLRDFLQLRLAFEPEAAALAATNANRIKIRDIEIALMQSRTSSQQADESICDATTETDKAFSDTNKAFSSAEKAFSGNDKAFSGTNKAFNGTDKDLSGTDKAFSDAEIAAGNNDVALNNAEIAISDTGHALSADIAFHSAILAATDNPFYMQLTSFIESSLKAGAYFSQLREINGSKYAEKRAVYEAIATGQAEEARSVFRHMLQSMIESLETVLKTDTSGEPLTGNS